MCSLFKAHMRDHMLSGWVGGVEALSEYVISYESSNLLLKKKSRHAILWLSGVQVAKVLSGDEENLAVGLPMYVRRYDIHGLEKLFQRH